MPGKRKEAIGGTSVAAVGRKPKRIEGVRICSASGCPTKLSVYNEDAKECFLHRTPKQRRIRGSQLP